MPVQTRSQSKAATKAKLDTEALSRKKAAKKQSGRRTTPRKQIAKRQTPGGKSKLTINLRKMAGLKDTTVYNGEKFTVTSKWVPASKSIYDEFGEHLLYAFDFADQRRQEAVLKTCDTRFDHMAEQMWSVHDGKLYLELQENNSTSSLCVGTPHARKVFRGAVRRIWCLFLQHGLREKIFSRDTVIELEARGWLPAQRDVLELRKTIPALTEFYKRLGFRQVGIANAKYDSPLMRSTVGATLNAVCVDTDSAESSEK